MKMLFAVIFISASSAFALELRLESSGIAPKFYGPLLAKVSTDSRGQSPIGLYTGAGSWSEGTEHWKAFLKEHGYGYRTFSKDEFLAASLNATTKRILIMPGGQS